MTQQRQHVAPLASPALEARVRALGPWFHNLNLMGIQTAPEHFLGDYPKNKWQRFAHALPENLRGKSVLDIGCNAGFFSFEMKRRGAQRVVGIDIDSRYLAQAQLAAEILGLDIEWRKLSAYEVGKLQESFDLVLFTGVFYHLRYPVLALDTIRRHVVRDLLVFQSMLRGGDEVANLAPDYPFSECTIFERADYPRLHFVERSYAGDPNQLVDP